MDGEAWQATVHGVAKESDTTEQLSTHVALIICHILNPFSPHNIRKIDAILIPVLQMRKLRQKEGM